MSKELNKKMTDAAEKTGNVLRSRYGLSGIAIISFIESALPVPIITDPFLIAYILADKSKAVKAVVVTTLASVAGGAAAYLIAVGLFEVFFSQLIPPDTVDAILAMAAKFEEGAFLLTITGAVTPFPYTFVAIAAGLVKTGFLMFIIASIIGRGFRYSVEGFLAYKYGEKAVTIIRKQIVLFSVLCVIAIGLYVLIKI